MTRLTRALHDGRAAEWLAAMWLRLHGWRILATRVRTPVGEIDIIARRRRWLIFVEVKRRPGRREALAALRPHQQRRIARAAACWLAGQPWAGDLDMRFDYVMIHGNWRLEHLKDVFRPEDVGLH